MQGVIRFLISPEISVGRTESLTLTPSLFAIFQSLQDTLTDAYRVFSDALDLNGSILVASLFHLPRFYLYYLGRQ